MARVLEVMQEVGFVPNQLARQLRTGDNTTIGMIVLNVANPFFANLAHACESAAELKGFTVVLGSSDQLDEREERYLSLFEQQRVRGIVVAPLSGLTEGMRRLQRRGMPMVLFDVGSDDPTFCSVALDGRDGGYLAARHLIETGRTHIAFLGGPLRQVEDRWYGAMRACAEVSGVRLSRIDTAETAFADGRAVGPVLEQMFADERPDAVLAANDSLALGLLQYLTLSSTISVPGDLAVIGYDDIDYAAAAIVPLSTVRQPVDKLAAEALRLVLGESDADHQHESVKLTPELFCVQHGLDLPQLEELLVRRHRAVDHADELPSGWRVEPSTTIDYRVVCDHDTVVYATDADRDQVHLTGCPHGCPAQDPGRDLAHTRAE